MSQEMTEQLELMHTAAWLCTTEELGPELGPCLFIPVLLCTGNESSLFFP